MSYPIKSPRKLIEVALPLDAINAACTRGKSIRHGHHLWWARRPLAAARAVIFAQMVNDPGYQQGGGFKYGKKKKEAAEERKRLFKIIEDLVLWENTTNEVVLERARVEMEEVAAQAKPTWKPDLQLPDDPRNFWTLKYGLNTYANLFTARQLVALTTFSDLVGEACERVRADGFTKQSIPMVWDFAESNPLSSGTGNWEQTCVNWVVRVLCNFAPAQTGLSRQADAAAQTISDQKIISTDPPYYDNISYADLSDYFYIWMRRTIRKFFPDIFATIAVPKVRELIATPYRHGGKDNAEAFFLHRMSKAMECISLQAREGFPISIYYAFKQSDTGWETFLSALISAGFALCGTWPMRTERVNRSVGIGTNSLASSIVIVCRKRLGTAPTTSRRAFLRELNATLPSALDEMTNGTNTTHSPVAPVDLSQAIIGPGMSVFSKYSAVLEADGTPMSIRTALQLINRFLAEDDFDPDTQFCLHWFEQHNWNEGLFGEADVLARSKSTSVDTMKQAGVLHSGAGKVRLLKWAEYPTDWDPTTDNSTPIREALHQLIRSLNQNGESHTGSLLANLEDKPEGIRQLAYRLYTLCERLGQAEDARVYNQLIPSWSGVEAAAVSARPDTSQLAFKF